MKSLIPDMNPIALARIQSQKLADGSEMSPKELTSWFGAIQAQDFSMNRFAISVRTSLNDAAVLAAFDSGEIIRTHVLRPTWHLASKEDIGWMLELSAPYIKKLMASMNKSLNLAESIYQKCNDHLSDLLAGKHLTREEIYAELNILGIETGNMRGLHILMNAELDRVICSGKMIGSKPTYALFSERVGKFASRSTDEALADLATRYFRSHGPATVKDFIWWSGLPAALGKKAVSIIESKMQSRNMDLETYHAFSFDDLAPSGTILLLPAFDEYLIAYKNRSSAIETLFATKAFTRNGIFNPCIIWNGQVIGIWKRSIKKDDVIIEYEYFYPVDASIKKAVRLKAEEYASFVSKQLIHG